jgi:hypothetical protein
MTTATGSFLPEIKEHFIGWDIVADQAEYAVDTDPAVEVLATAAGAGGVIRITMDAGQSNVGGMLIGQTQWDITNGLYFEARVKLSAIGAAAERVGIWFTDLQEDTLSEYPFTMSATALTAAANPDDAVGIFWEGDGPDSWVLAGQNNDSITADSIASPKKLVAPVATEWQVLALSVAPGGNYVTAHVDGVLIGEYKNNSTPVTADVLLIPVFGVTEGTTAINFDVDYVWVRTGLAA